MACVHYTRIRVKLKRVGDLLGPSTDIVTLVVKFLVSVFYPYNIGEVQHGSGLIICS